MPRTAALALVLVLTILLGCGRRSGHVSGTVTVDGRPLEYGMVNFVGQGGAASAPVSDGGYEAASVPLGRMGISVRAMPRPAVAGPPAGGGGWPFAPLPERYATPEQSGLSVDVVAGDQRHDLVLTSR